MPEMSEWIVGARSGAGGAEELQQVIEAIPALPNARLKSGSPAKFLVIEMGDDAAQQLKQRFGERLIIEPNQKLNF